MSVQSFAEASDRSLHPTDAKTDKNYFVHIPQENPIDPEMKGEGNTPLYGTEPLLQSDAHLASGDNVSHAPNSTTRARSSGPSRSKAPKLKTKGNEGHPSPSSSSSTSTSSDNKNEGKEKGKGKAKTSVDHSSLKQKALDLVHKGSEEIAYRSSHAYDDMKHVSKKVSDRMNGKPYQLAMGAASVVGLGMALAKKYTQNRSMKSPGSPPPDTLHS